MKDNFLVKSFIGLVFFILGFALGTILDFVIYKAYSKLDPSLNNYKKLLGVCVVQSYLIILCVLTFSYWIPLESFYSIMFRLSFFSTQIFLGGYIIFNITNKLGYRVFDYTQIPNQQSSNTPKYNKNSLRTGIGYNIILP